MRRLVGIHKIHINRTPWNITIILRMKMQQWLVQNLQAINPHFCRGKGMHPGNYPDTVGIMIGISAKIVNLFGRL